MLSYFPHLIKQYLRKVTIIFQYHSFSSALVIGSHLVASRPGNILMERTGSTYSIYRAASVTQISILSPIYKRLFSNIDCESSMLNSTALLGFQNLKLSHQTYGDRKLCGCGRIAIWPVSTSESQPPLKSLNYRSSTGRLQTELKPTTCVITVSLSLTLCPQWRYLCI